MDHAFVMISDFAVPLIGIDPAATKETCDRCGKVSHLQSVELTMIGFLCLACALYLKNEPHYINIGCIDMGSEGVKGLIEFADGDSDRAHRFWLRQLKTGL